MQTNLANSIYRHAKPSLRKKNNPPDSKNHEKPSSTTLHVDFGAKNLHPKSSSNRKLVLFAGQDLGPKNPP